MISKYLEALRRSAVQVATFIVIVFITCWPFVLGIIAALFWSPDSHFVREGGALTLSIAANVIWGILLCVFLHNLARVEKERNPEEIQC